MSLLLRSDADGWRSPKKAICIDADIGLQDKRSAVISKSGPEACNKAFALAKEIKYHLHVDY